MALVHLVLHESRSRLYFLGVTPHRRKIDGIVPKLLKWFSVHARDLPWRQTRDPYAIWVSEIMLQQTQVKTVLPYWTRWMKALPSIRALARANPQRLHKLWEGLGYYHRVRNLQRAAQEIVAKYGRAFPDRFEDVLALPGIGRYTAGAICSIAFNQPQPVLDGNVIRVLTRLHAVAGDSRDTTVNRRLWKIAGQLVHEAANSRAPHACSRLNQALMELGALVCTARRPECGACPLNHHCLAHQDRRVEDFPQPTRHARPTPRRFAAFVVLRNGRYLVRQRPRGGVNGELWEFPNCELELNEANPRSKARACCKVSADAFEPFCTVKHSITRYRITLEAFQARLNRYAARRPSAGRWLELKALQRLPFASAHRKILTRLTSARL